MPFFALVVEDPKAHRDAALQRQLHELLTKELQLLHREAAREKRAVSAVEHARVANASARVARDIVGDAKEIGDLHTVALTECPDGLPNCRNCGDPAHEAQCRKAGHCPHCGTRHGTAPASYLARSGIVLKEITPPPFMSEERPPVIETVDNDLAVVTFITESYEWDRTQRDFVRKEKKQRFATSVLQATRLEQSLKTNTPVSEVKHLIRSQSVPLSEEDHVIVAGPITDMRVAVIDTLKKQNGLPTAR